MVKLGTATKRRVRSASPYLVVLVVATMAVALVATGYGSGNPVAVKFGAYQQPPSSYVPGTNPPDLFLQINYTARGTGNFTYVVTYNSTAGEKVAGNETFLVSHLSPDTAFFSIPVAVNATVVVQAFVYENVISSQHLVFNETVLL